MSDESNVTPTDEAAAPDLEQRVDKLEDEVKELQHDAPTTANAPTAAESDPATPANPGENLERTETNPTIDPHQPGVEPGAVTDEGAPNAPASTNPEGDTSQQNAPIAPAPEPEGADVATNPGTPQPGGESQAEVPPGTTSGDVPPPSNTSDAGDPPPTPPGETDTPEPTAVPQPAADASEKPLYVYVGDDPSYQVAAGYMASGLVTPDGKVLYHYTDDTAGEPATGAIDGELGVYADDAVPVAG